MSILFEKSIITFKEKNFTLNRTRRLKRYCAICGKDIIIIVHPDKTYTGGNYFFKVETDNGKEAEYWECDNCYKSWD